MVEACDKGAHLFALAAALIMQLRELYVDRVPMRIDQFAQAGGGNDTLLDRDTVLRGLRPRNDVSLQTAFGLLDPAFEKLLTLVETGVANLKILTS